MDLEALTSSFDELAGAVPGCQVVVRDHGSWLTLARGVADVTTGVAVTDTTPFPVASVTKAWLSALAIMLVSDEGLAPDDSLAELLPGARFSLRQLVAHTAGFPTRLEVPGRTLAEWARAAVRSEHVGTPGEYFCYSNAGAIVLGALIESVTGTSWVDSIRAFLAEPLGVSVWSAHRPGLPSATGHISVDAGWLPVQLPFDDGPQAVPGGLAMSAHALAALASAMLDGTGPFDLDPTSRSLMLEEQTTAQPLRSRGIDPGITGCGLVPLPGQPTVLSLTGSTDGIEAAVRLDQREGSVVAMTTNGDAGAAVWRELLEALGAASPSDGDPTRGPDSGTGAGLDDLLGRYQDGPDVVDVRREDGATQLLIDGVRVAQLVGDRDRVLIIHPKRGLLGRGRYVPGPDRDVLHLGSRLVWRDR